MSSNFKLQQMLHKMEEGNMSNVIKLLALAFLGLGLLIVVAVDPLGWGFFRGLSHEKGIEQAQIAREIASGNGYGTRMIRPLAVRQIQNHLEGTELEGNKEELNRRISRDTYHAPLWSATLAPIYKALEKYWELNSRKPIYILDKATAITAILLFFAAVIVNFYTLRRLFDVKLAVLASGIQLVTYSFWQYAMSGLPQMLMLLIFSGLMWVAVRAIGAKEEGKSYFRWIVLMGVLGGLLVLAHYITAWLLLGVLLFIAIYFPHRLRNTLVFTLIILAMVSPWLIRNYQITGHPFGIAWVSILHGVVGAEEDIMRRLDPAAMEFHYSYFRHKIQEGLTAQISGAPAQLAGWFAPLFFITLLYPFKRAGLRVTRWLLLAAWCFALLGMAVANAHDITSGLSATNLHLLFIPLFAAYGTAFILNLWAGIKLPGKFFDNALAALILLIAGLPFINAFLSRSFPLWWPPYAPPYMTFLEKWTQDKEVIISDMPWAVGWYARRDSLWLPATKEEFLNFYDYDRLGRNYGGLFLTPVTENAAFMGDIVRGKYESWMPQIVRMPRKDGFPFAKGVGLGPHQMCIFYSDYERWSAKETEALKKMQEQSEADAAARRSMRRSETKSESTEGKSEKEEESQ